VVSFRVKYVTKVEG